MANGIRPVRDLGGLGQLAQTILQKRGLEQEALDRDLRRRIGEGQLSAQEEARTLAGEQRTTQQGLAGIFAGATPADQIGPPVPSGVLTQRAAQVPGATLADLASFATTLEAVRPPPEKAPAFKTDEQIRLEQEKSRLRTEEAGEKFTLKERADAGSQAIKDLKDQRAADTDVKKAEQKQVNVLRANIENNKKDFNQVNAAFERIKRVGQARTPAGDLALIFNFMKMLDPGSVVRESEFRTAEAAKAWLVEQEDSGIVIPAPISNFIRRAEEGTLLEPAQRVDFVTQANDLLSAQSEATDGQIRAILDQGAQDGIGSERILGGAEASALRSRREARGEAQALQAEFGGRQVEGGTEVTIEEGARAVNQQTGEVIEFRSGQWVKVQ